MAVVTPLNGDGSVDAARLLAHCQGLLVAGCDGIALFGTSGEGPSFSVAERMAVLEALLAGGLPPDRIIVGAACAALPDVAALSHHAAAAGCAAVLMMPPFFFDGVDDEGVFRAYATAIETTGTPAPKVLLYHIPKVSRVPLGLGLIERLAAAFPDIVVGVKDSSGDWPSTERLLERRGDLRIFVGHEPHVGRAIANGGAGTICGIANAAPTLLRRLCDAPAGPAGSAARLAVDQVAAAFDGRPVIPTLKALTAAASGFPGWNRLRPPLTPLADDDQEAVARLLRSAQRAATVGAPG
ncbi:MAG: dihydrodipicolinate synthase family protein [Inquilinus sp.]|nr:dihydrodipicolinate synthase family protein [Inquilinus sp.]